MPVERVKVGNEGYINFLKIVRENKEESSITATTLKDLIPDFQGDVNSCELAKFKLYSHQVRAFEALKNGKNVILASSTGSGKTEAWFIYLLYLIYTRGKARALVIYPTVALGKDQETRLSGYFEKCVDTISMNGPVRYDGEYDRNYDSLDYAKNASIVITNPEKIARNLHSRVRLAPFNNIDFIVLDEFDFYSSAQALKLLTLLKTLYKEIIRKNSQEKDVPQLVIMSATLRDSISLRNLNDRETEFVTGVSPKPKFENYLLYLNDEDDEFLKDLDRYLDGKQIIKSHDPRSRNDPLARARVLVSLKHDTTLYKIFLKSMADKDGLTFLFTNYISEAERLFYELNPNESDEKIGIHHSLRGDPGATIQKVNDNIVKLLISVKTMGQGVNFRAGNRVVHYGLPELVREFIQREGRKGRDPNIQTVESVIFPRSIGDLIPFTGQDPEQTFMSWLNLGPESIILSYDSELSRFFESIFSKAVRNNVLGEEVPLSRAREDPLLQDLRDIGFIKFYRGSKLSSQTERTKRVSASFYTIENKAEAEVRLDEPSSESTTTGSIARIPYEKMVRYYQPGAIDYALHTVVKSVVSVGHGKGIKEESVEPKRDNEGKIRYIINEVTTELLDKYLKSGGDAADLGNEINSLMKGLRLILNSDKDFRDLKDYSIDQLIQTGRLISRVSTEIKVKGSVSETRVKDGVLGGLVRYEEFPSKITWYVYSPNNKVKSVTVPLRARVHLKGITYAYAISGLSQNSNMEKYIAILRVALRKIYNVPLDLIVCSLPSKKKKELLIWESEPMGFLPMLLENKKMTDGTKQITRNELIQALKNLKYDEQTKILLRINHFRYGFPLIRENEFDSIVTDTVQFLENIYELYRNSRLSNFLGHLFQENMKNVKIMIPLDSNNDRFLEISAQSFKEFRNINELLKQDENDYKDFTIYTPKGPKFPIFLCRYPRVIPLDLQKILNKIENMNIDPYDFLNQLLNQDIEQLEKFLELLVSNLVIGTETESPPSGICVTRIDERTWNGARQKLGDKKIISFTIDKKLAQNNSIYFENLNNFDKMYRRELFLLYANNGKLYNFFADQDNKIIGFGFITSIGLRDKCVPDSPKFSRIDFVINYILRDDAPFLLSLDEAGKPFQEYEKSILDIISSNDKANFGIYCTDLRDDILKRAITFFERVAVKYSSSELEEHKKDVADIVRVERGNMTTPTIKTDVQAAPCPIVKLFNNLNEISQEDFERPYHYYLVLSKLSQNSQPVKVTGELATLGNVGIICTKKGKLVTFKYFLDSQNPIERAGLQYYMGIQTKIPSMITKYLVGGEGKFIVIPDPQNYLKRMDENQIGTIVGQLVKDDDIIILQSYMELLSKGLDELNKIPGKSKSIDEAESFINAMIRLGLTAQKFQNLLGEVKSRIDAIKSQFGVDVKVELGDDRNKLIQKIAGSLRTNSGEKFFKLLESRGTDTSKVTLFSRYLIQGKGVWLSDTLFYALPGEIRIANLGQDLGEIINVEKPTLIRLEPV